MHTRLWGDVTIKYAAVIDKYYIDDKEKLISIETNGFKLMTLGYQEHFIYLLIHAIKHFIIKGVGVKNLMDLSLYFNRHNVKMDIPAIWEIIGEMGFRSTMQHLFSVCVDYLGMSDKIFYEKKPDLDQRVSDALIEDILMGGALGSVPTRTIAVSAAKESYYIGLHGKSGLALFFHLLFPRPFALPPKYKYAKKYPILLPAAWINRMFNFVYNRIVDKSKINLFGSIKLVGARIKLLEDLELIN
jgi:hypothetical protein